ncbi:MAG: hypothetical protein AAGI17_06160 [Planctomycetota bacterium]
MKRRLYAARGYTLAETIVASTGGAIVLSGAVAAMTFGARVIDESAIAPARERSAMETALLILSDGRYAESVETTGTTDVTIELQKLHKRANSEYVNYAWDGAATSPIAARLNAIEGQLATRDEELGKLSAAEADALTQISKLRRGVDEFQVFTRERDTQGSGYSNFLPSRFTMTLTTGAQGPGPLTFPGFPYDRMRFTINSEDDRFQNPAAENDGVAFPIASQTLRRDTVEFIGAATATDLSVVPIHMDVVGDWEVIYIIWHQGTISSSGIITGNGPNVFLGGVSVRVD